MGGPGIGFEGTQEKCVHIATPENQWSGQSDPRSGQARDRRNLPLRNWLAAGVHVY